MFLPDYSITSKTLGNISIFEYARGLIETTPLLQNYERKLEKETKIEEIHSLALISGFNINLNNVKEFIDGVSKPKEQIIDNLNLAMQNIEELSYSPDLEETDIKYLHKLISNTYLPRAKSGIYRSTKIENGTKPEEILAEVMGITNWFNSYDAMDMHPLIVAALIKAGFELIKPFENFNNTIASLLALLALRKRRYSIISYVPMDMNFMKNQREYFNILDSDEIKEGDFSEWIEFFTENMASLIKTVEQKVTIFGRDSKINKNTEKAYLTDRQEKILEHIQDYGGLQNKQFTTLFPMVSEDSILRDLKKLVEVGLIMKKGKTKSSRYETR